MSRPRDAVQTRQIILDAAENEFAEHGFGGSRIDQIAKRSGYNKSLIFQYFLSKENLYFEVMLRVRERLDAAFLARFGQLPPLDASTARDLIGEAVRYFFRQLLEYPNAQRLFAWSAAEGWQAYSLRLGRTEPAIEFGKQFLENAQKLGWIRPELETDTLVMLIMTLPQAMISAAPRFLQQPNPSELEQLCEQIVQLLSFAIQPSVLSAASANIKLSKHKV